MKAKAITLAVLVLGTASAAMAHAVLRHATPAAGAVVTRMPDEIDLEFSEAVVWARVELRSGTQDGPLVQLAGSERLASPSTMVRRPIVGVHKSGSYDVSWRVLSVDGHVTSGAYAFEVE